MRHALFAAAGLAAAVVMTGNAAQAQADPTCTTDAESVWDMSAEEVSSFYACMEAWMARCYAQNGHEVGANYRDWTVSSTRPAVAGPHSARLLQTFANDTAAEQYLKFESEGVEMPAGLGAGQGELFDRERHGRDRPALHHDQARGGRVARNR